MSKSPLKQYLSSINNENIPNNGQNNMTIARKRLKPEERVISHKELVSSADTESTETEKVSEEYEEVVEDENAVKEESLKEDKVGSFFDPVYSGEGFHRALNFKEECGEPLRNQHLMIDFSPIEGVDDNEFIMKKCQDFWTMIEENRRIHKLRASPESYYDKGLVRSTFYKPTKNVEPTATNWLIHSPELIREAFATENKKLYCDDDNYTDLVMKTGRKKDLGRERLVPGVSVTAHRSVIRKSGVKASDSSTLTDVAVLCRQMETWDLSHPKFMEPPGHAPQLTHAVTKLRNK